MPNSLKCKIKHLCHNGTITERERDRILKALEQEPCEDAISRQAVLEFLKGFEILHDHDELRSNLIYGIMGMPPVTPQQKTGHWINADGNSAICDCCNRLNRLYGAYCKHCGAKMESEDKK